MRKMPIAVLCAMLFSSAAIAAEGSDKTFDKLDKNHDGSISRKEFSEGKVKINREKAIKLFPGMHDIKRVNERELKERVFNLMDGNHDGILSRDEWRRVAPNILEIRF